MNCKLRIAGGGWRVKLLGCWIACFVVFTITACGGGPPAEPTAIPASVARPQQDSPDLVQGKPVFDLPDVSITAVMIPETEGANSLLSDATPEGTPTPIQLLFQLPPSALGIATGGAVIVDKPGGTVLATVPAGSTLTVTGRSADGKFLAVYEDDGVFGWVAVGTLKLFGADDLTIVEQSISPAPVATMMAQAMLPPATSALDVAMTAMAESTPFVMATPVP